MPDEQPKPDSQQDEIEYLTHELHRLSPQNLLPDTKSDATFADETSETETNAPTETLDGVPSASNVTSSIPTLAQLATVAIILLLVLPRLRSTISPSSRTVYRWLNQATNHGS